MGKKITSESTKNPRIRIQGGLSDIGKTSSTEMGFPRLPFTNFLSIMQIFLHRCLPTEKNTIVLCHVDAMLILVTISAILLSQRPRTMAFGITFLLVIAVDAILPNKIISKMDVLGHSAAKNI